MTLNNYIADDVALCTHCIMHNIDKSGYIPLDEKLITLNHLHNTRVSFKEL